ncbi:MAG: hypothetical protein EVA89_12115 [Sandaracinaceae bacterium]|nr:MAG: hypothetical protein EVA89_12115 [Sandaracinaceae bacterium]
MKRLAACCLLLASAVGCEGTQPWQFRNGTGLDGTAPAQLIAEVYTGAECGFACAPPGERTYCEQLERGQRGTPPTGLVAGERYCFLGTALDEEGRAYAIGCTVAEVGGGPIEVTLSPIDEGRVIVRQCAPTPRVELDAGRMDSGTPFDAGPPPDAGADRDGGPPPDAGPLLDAGPPRGDAGLPFGTPVVVHFEVFGPGAAWITEADTGRGIGPQPLRPRTRLRLEAYVGFVLTIDAEADPDGTLTGIDGACGTNDPCTIRLDRSEDIGIRFAR